MHQGLNIVDFHTHLQGTQPLANLCAADQQSRFFRHAVPHIEKIADICEPLHQRIVRHMALNYRGKISRHLYSRLSQLGLMEALRLFKRNDLNSLLKGMNLNGIKHSVVYSLEPLMLTGDLIELTEPFREQISIFASVSKHHDDPPAYFKKLLDSGSVCGLKIHPIVGGYACGELYEATHELVALAAEYDLPTVIHTGHIPVEYLKGISGCNEVKAIEPLIAGFPKAKFVLAHIGWESWRQVLAFGQSYSNVLVETSWQPARIIRRAVDTLGAHRVIFGSDFPLFTQAQALHQVQKALSPREFVQVASVNALRLLKMPYQEKSSSAS